MGPFARTSTSFYRALGHDYEYSIQYDWNSRRHCYCSHLLHVVRSYSIRLVRHGRHKRHVAQSEIALGGGDEQAFHGRRRKFYHHHPASLRSP